VANARPLQSPPSVSSVAERNGRAPAGSLEQRLAVDELHRVNGWSSCSPMSKMVTILGGAGRRPPAPCQEFVRGCRGSRGRHAGPDGHWRPILGSWPVQPAHPPAAEESNHHERPIDSGCVATRVGPDWRRPHRILRQTRQPRNIGGAGDRLRVASWLAGEPILARRTLNETLCRVWACVEPLRTDAGRPPVRSIC